MQKINSSFINLFNKILKFSQDKCVYLSENSMFLKNIDNLILISILVVFILSTFLSSDYIGFMALITLFLTIVKIFLKQGEKVELNLFEAFLLIYFLFVVISLAGSTLFHLSFKGFLKTFTYLGFYFSAVQYYKNNLSKIPLTIGIIALCAVSQSFFGILQNFAKISEISTWQDVSNLNPEQIMTRVYGTLRPYNPNLLGGYLVATLPSVLGITALTLFSKKYLFAIISFVLSGLTAFTLILTGCRGAYVGLVVILGLFFLFLGKLIWNANHELLKKIYISITGLCIAGATSIVLLVSSIRARVLSMFTLRADSSTSFRLNVYQAAFKMAQDNWALGIGLGNKNFREIYGLYMKTGFDALSAYNIYLEISLESGIFSLFAFLAFVLTLIYQAVKFILNSKDVQKTIILATSVISIIAVLVHGFVDTIFFRPHVQFIFWTMCAFVSVILYPENHNRCECKNSDNNNK